MPDPDPACDPVFLIGILILLDLILKMFIKKTDEQCCRSESKLDPYLTTLWIHVPNLDPDPHLLTNLDTDP